MPKFDGLNKEQEAVIERFLHGENLTEQEQKDFREAVMFLHYFYRREILAYAALSSPDFKEKLTQSFKQRAEEAAQGWIDYVEKRTVNKPDGE